VILLATALKNVWRIALLARHSSEALYNSEAGQAGIQFSLSIYNQDRELDPSFRWGDENN
jgi:hypothetical protein